MMIKKITLNLKQSVIIQMIYPYLACQNRITRDYYQLMMMLHLTLLSLHETKSHMKKYQRVYLKSNLDIPYS